MTPTAVTPAGQGTRSKPRPTASRPTASRPTASRPTAARTSSARTAGHRPPLTRPTAPRSPRRVSGPARRTRTPQQPAVRIPLTSRSVAYIRTLPDHAFLDRIIRGRAWIPLLGVLLVGIVAMQVEVLKLNAATGRALEQGTTLQTHNEQLRAAVADASDDQRIESEAAHMGMVMPQPAAVRFLAPDPAADVTKAAADVTAPNATNFTAVMTAAAAASGDTSSEAVAVPTSGNSGTAATSTGG
jgi:hypothetical protein